jgi:hypothetical protein
MSRRMQLFSCQQSQLWNSTVELQNARASRRDLVGTRVIAWQQGQCHTVRLIPQVFLLLILYPLDLGSRPRRTGMAPLDEGSLFRPSSNVNILFPVPPAPSSSTSFPVINPLSTVPDSLSRYLNTYLNRTRVLTIFQGGSTTILGPQIIFLGRTHTAQHLSLHKMSTTVAKME